MPTLSVTATTYNSATLAFAAEAADGTNEVQFAIRSDFKFCVSPVMTGIARGSTPTIQKLNQDSPYYARVRARRASGVAEAWSPVIPFRTPVNVARVLTPAAVMIQPSILVVPNKVTESDGAAITGYGTSNLFIDAPVAWRSSHATAHQFYARMAPEAVDIIALLNTNIPEDATIRAQAGTTTSFSNYDSGALPFRASANVPGRPGHHGLMRLPSPQSYEHWLITIAAVCPGNILHAEHAIFGKNRTSKNHSTDKSESTLDLGSLDRLRSGNPNRVNGYRMRRVDFDIAALTQAQYETQYGDLRWKVGGTDPVLVVPNSKADAFLHDRILYGAISAGRDVNTHSPYFTRSFTIDSLI